MRDSKTIQIRDEKVTAKELEVADIDQILKTINTRTVLHPTELLLDVVIPVEAVALSTGLAEGELAGKECHFTPSELDEIWKAVAEVNDFLSLFLEKLAAEGHALLLARRSGNGVVA